MVLKQRVYDKIMSGGFRSLQTYMVLKLFRGTPQFAHGFRSLQTYMVLKRTYSNIWQLLVLDPYKLTWFSNKPAARQAVTVF